MTRTAGSATGTLQEDAQAGGEGGEGTREGLRRGWKRPSAFGVLAVGMGGPPSGMVRPPTMRLSPADSTDRVSPSPKVRTFAAGVAARVEVPMMRSESPREMVAPSIVTAAAPRVIVKSLATIPAAAPTGKISLLPNVETGISEMVIPG